MADGRDGLVKKVKKMREDVDEGGKKSRLITITQEVLYLSPCFQQRS